MTLHLLRVTNHIILDFELKKTRTKENLWYGSTSSPDLKLSTSSKNSLSFLKENADSNNFSNNIKTYFKSNESYSYYSPLMTIANVNFLRKERLYTKLKYSRSPAYDIVSGGMAALLAGFVGFLISEKFGFELVDSGDFYFLFMYIVFLCFSVRPLLITFNSKTTFMEAVSVKPIIKFYLNAVFFILNKFK